MRLILLMSQTSYKDLVNTCRDSPGACRKHSTDYRKN